MFPRILPLRCGVPQDKGMQINEIDPTESQRRNLNRLMVSRCTQVVPLLAGWRHPRAACLALGSPTGLVGSVAESQWRRDDSAPSSFRRTRHPVRCGQGRRVFADVRLACAVAAGAGLRCSARTGGACRQGAGVRARQLGLDVSGRLAIAGFNDLPAAAWMHPALSTVRTTRGRIGELAANMLLTLMRGETPEQHCIDVGFELVMRDSA